jgi:hypothetical protein
LKGLEAAIGIEPMNKGFAVCSKLFAQDRDCSRKCTFVDAFEISSLVMIAEIEVCFDW